MKCTWAIEICTLHSVAKPFRKRITLDKRVLQCPQKAQPLLSNLSVIMMLSTTKDIHSVHDHHKGYFIISKDLQLSVLLSLPNSSESSTNHGITFWKEFGTHKCRSM